MIIRSYKPSAYRSMLLSKYGYSKPTTKKNKKDLMRWTEEEWINLNAWLYKNQILPCGKKYKGQTTPTICRPIYKISENTPSPLAFELTPLQIKKAIKMKEKGLRINWKNI